MRGVQIEDESEVSVIKWLENSSYTLAQKVKILSDFTRFTGKSVPDINKAGVYGKVVRHDSFIKLEFPDIGLKTGPLIQETAPALKNARCIQGASNIAKVMFNPVFNAIADRLFHLNIPRLGYCPFAKGLQVSEVPRFVEENLRREGEKYSATDHTAFEAHASIEAMIACEMQVYKFAVAKMPWARKWFEGVFEAMTWETKCRFRSVKLTTHDCRMSGDGCTSLGNGITNFFLIEFAAFKSRTHVRQLVEGDDGILVCSHNFPGAEFFKKLGFDVKIDSQTELNRVGFLSLEWDAEEQFAFRDPRSVLSRFGLSFSEARHGGKEVIQGLLRAKAFSLLALYPDEPILNTLASRVLDLTEGIKERFDKIRSWKDEYVARMFIFNRNQVLSKKWHSPTQRSRNFVAENYGISVGDQHCIEKVIKQTAIDGELDCECFKDIFPASWALLAEKCTITCYKGMPWTVNEFASAEHVRSIAVEFSSRKQWPNDDTSSAVFTDSSDI